MLSAELLSESDQRVARDFSPLNNLIIWQHDRIVWQRAYRPGLSLDQLQPMRSVTKSVLSALVGVAIDQGAIKDVHQPLGDLLEPHITKSRADLPILNSTLHQVLSMTNGSVWRNGRYSHEPLAERMMASDDWLGFVLSLPVEKKQINHFQYNSGLSHVLSAVVQSAVGMSASEYAQRVLFKPLGIEAVHWETDPAGYSIGGFGLQLSPLNMLAFGQLYLNQGVYAGNRVLPKSWVDSSIKSHTENYGYQWWLRTLGGQWCYCAQGIGGQTICCIPALEAVIVTTAGFAGRRKWLWPLFDDYWVPALASSSTTL